MSYCRWSSDNFTCDLYCYEDARGGFITHVAGARQRTWFRFFCWLTDKRWNLESTRYRTFRFNWIYFPQRLTHKNIKLPESEETFYDNTVEEFYERIRGLVKIGYKVPKNLLSEIKRNI